MHKGIFILGFEGVNTRDEILQYRNHFLATEIDLENEGDGEDDFHVQQLIGLKVYSVYKVSNDVKVSTDGKVFNEYKVSNDGKAYPADEVTNFDTVSKEEKVNNGNKEYVGDVKDVLNLPGQDVICINHNGVEKLIPFVKEFVPTIDIKNKIMLINPPIGLFEDADSSDKKLKLNPTVTKNENRFSNNFSRVF